MKNLGKAVIAVVALMGTLSACFSDPTSDLRDGPTRLSLSNQFLIQDVGDSDQINIQLFDDQGNSLPFGDPTFTSLDPAVATIIPLPDPLLRTVPGGTLYKSVLAALSEGTTKVAVTVNGITDTVTVIVLPSTAPGATVAANTTFGPGTEITIPAPPLTTFNTTGTVSTVLFGGVAGTVIARTATSITAISPVNFNGRVTVKDLTSQNLPVDSVLTAIVTVNRAPFIGAITVAASSFGPGTQMTLLAPAGATFNAAAGAAGSQVTFGATNATVLSRTATQIDVIATAAYTGPVTVSGMTLTAGAVALPPLTTLGNQTIAPAFFPGTVAGAGNLLNTITISGGPATFTTVAATASQVTIGGLPAFVRSRSATTMTVVARNPANAPISISNVIVAGVTIPTLSTQANVNVLATTGEGGEPGNNNMLSVVTLTPTATFDTLYGVLTSGSDGNDFFRVTLAAPARIAASLDFVGTGTGTAPNPDIDVYVTRDVNGNGVVNAADICNEFGGTFAEADCTGATAVQPENELTQVLPAGTYFINVELFLDGGITTPMVYRLRYRLQ